MRLKFPAIILLFIIGNSLVLRAEEIQMSDIGGQVTLIGRLGKPVGTVVTNIEGQLISEPKQGKSGQVTAALRVSKIDGKALAKAQIVGLVFRASQGMPKIHANENVKFSGYESGAFIGTPEVAREALGKDASPLDWKFESTVFVIKLL
jgi:predicted ABC-type transport system involved in lysophospholipase L1 biosynthesis ATPase subunit